MTDTTPEAHPLEQLPGDLMMWVLIVSELLVFGAGLAAFLSVRITDPAAFASAQDHLHRAAAGINTLVLVTSGFLAALAVRAAEHGRIARTRMWLSAASLLGVVFLVIKTFEFIEKAQQGIGIETSTFFTFYYLMTGFHAAHVVAGIVILGLVGIRCTPRTVEVGAAFWHMVDLVWVLLFPVIYLLR
ncbi:cytochrome c oxidase subunit 3 family protein [Sedimentimonas flavescens]|uniref:cytochrome c oxidase subunit 3 family protein n=1 Tax=Sedimentimonas flavescens TaxID=2851012 RepID=UPI0021A542CC|nr:cytochrome c oxidase subunit 3 family protein [Sedimentimonas flavescens]MCT2539574.1 cytochrome c oxidase subunit 3 family protein [Sedimentimonas flavescens]